MSFDPDRVATVPFDFDSTTVDVNGVSDARGRHLRSRNGGHVRRRSLRNAIASSCLDATQPFAEMLRDGLAYAEARHDPDFSADDRDEIVPSTTVSRSSKAFE